MDAKTTKWGAVASVALAFVLFAPDLIAQVPRFGPWIMAMAKFAAIGGLAKLGVEAADREPR